jgi:VIT1/CCC1 family predicted Fe2+/Mn2+ transporter
VSIEQIDEKHPHGGDWLREIVFGLNDGLVTTLVFIMAVSQVTPGHLLMIVLGEVLAGAISMTLGGFLSARTAKQILDQRIATERYEVENEPDEERAELRAIYYKKGYRDPLLRQIVDHLTSNRERWHQAMIHDELGVVEDTTIRPIQQATQIGLSFLIGGLIPALPVIFSLPFLQWWAYGLTAITAMTLGAIKARYTGQGALRAGLEFLVIVTIGTLAGVGVGLLLNAG